GSKSDLSVSFYSLQTCLSQYIDYKQMPMLKPKERGSKENEAMATPNFRGKGAQVMKKADLANSSSYIHQVVYDWFYKAFSNKGGKGGLDLGAAPPKTPFRAPNSPSNATDRVLRSPIRRGSPPKMADLSSPVASPAPDSFRAPKRVKYLTWEEFNRKFGSRFMHLKLVPHIAKIKSSFLLKPDPQKKKGGLYFTSADTEADILEKVKDAGFIIKKKK
ncbi:hypothetical protein DID77_04810, partial [Candidatus Marinamargulisbacteria bacterium SCGC AG-439-L15]